MLPYVSICISICIGDDFDVNTSDLTQSFLPGAQNGTLCLTIFVLTDNLVEGLEMLQIAINSSDEAVSITRQFVDVTIVDANTSK